jgi:hypothetical protein
MSTCVEVVRKVAEEFCLEFVEHPYLCYTEHGLHARFYAALLDALPAAERYTDWQGQRVCVVQKEYPTARPLGKSRRQHWDIGVVRVPPESVNTGDLPSYDYLKLAAAVEFGLNEEEEHLKDDVARLCSGEANVGQGFLIHLYRLSGPKSKFSARDWPPSQTGIMREDEVAKIVAGKSIEVLYGLYDHTRTRASGVWLINGRGVTLLHRR